MEKTCSKCGIPQDLSYFNLMSQSEDGHRPECKHCGKLARDSRSEEQKDAARAQQRAWTRENPDKRHAYNQKQYYANREKNLAKAKKYRLEKPEVSIAYRKTLSKQYVCDTAHRYSRKHPDRIRRQKQNYAKKYPDKIYNHNKRRRARLAGAQIIERIDRAAIVARDNSRCHICHKKVKKTDITLDHLIPLSKGGNHTADNLAVAHHACNSQRGDGKYIHAQLRLIG